MSGIEAAGIACAAGIPCATRIMCIAGVGGRWIAWVDAAIAATNRTQGIGIPAAT